MKVALRSHWGGFGVALRWLSGRNPLAINRLWGGFDMALGGFARALLHSAFHLRSQVFTINLPNTTRLRLLPRGGLGALWTNSGHVLVP
jgi:hypothetical protein